MGSGRLEGQVALLPSLNCPVQELDRHGHSDRYALGIRRVHALDPGIYPPTVVQLDNAHTVGVFSIVALGRHRGRWDVDAREGSQPSSPTQFDQFEVRAVAGDADRPWRNPAGAAVPTARTGEFFFLEEPIVCEIA